MSYESGWEAGEEGKMTKVDLVDRISETTGFKKADASDCLEALLDIIKNTLKTEDKLKISGFGNFEVREKEARRGRNPQTGEKMTIAGRRILTFRSSTVLRKMLNK